MKRLFALLAAAVIISPAFGATSNQDASSAKGAKGKTGTAGSQHRGWDDKEQSTGVGRTKSVKPKSDGPKKDTKAAQTK